MVAAAARSALSLMSCISLMSCTACSVRVLACDMRLVVLEMLASLVPCIAAPSPRSPPRPPTSISFMNCVLMRRAGSLSEVSPRLLQSASTW
jgi:hypothetical protein